MATPDVSKAVSDLLPSFLGALLLPDAEGYDEARRVHNGLVDKRPALIASCAGAADVAAAVRLGRELGFEIAVRGGGHNVAGRSTSDGGLLIDLSRLRAVSVDAAAKRARVGGGATWREVNRETQLVGLATTGGVVSSTGVAGLTLGGGFGWLMPKFGMATDNLVSADLILADGTPVRASADDHADLFWAIRGGGGNFGVATWLEFALHEVGPTVTGGLVAWPIDKAGEVLRFYRDLHDGLGDETFLAAALLTGPDGATKLVGIAAGHCGPLEAGAKALAPIKAFGSPVMDAMGPIPYEQLNQMLDGAFPRGARNYWKSHFLDALADEAIDAAVEAFASVPTPMCQFLLEGFHGAGTRVPVDATAYAMRTEGFNALVLAEWLDPAADAPCIAWARSTYEAIRPFGGARRYLNYLDNDDAGQEVLAAAYGPNLARLREIKRTYDPENVFHQNINIAPA
jgi:FAD/FMN-containing dehydrogenase